MFNTLKIGLILTVCALVGYGTYDLINCGFNLLNQPSDISVIIGVLVLLWSILAIGFILSILFIIIDGLITTGNVNLKFTKNNS